MAASVLHLAAMADNGAPDNTHTMCRQSVLWEGQVVTDLDRLSCMSCACVYMHVLIAQIEQLRQLFAERAGVS